MICLRLGAILCFAGWTWTHYYWESPCGVLIWHEHTYELAQRLGISWDEFVGTGANDGLVQTWLGRSWWVFFACTLASLCVRRRSWLQISLLITGFGFLTLISYAAFVNSQFQPPMFLEHGGQMLIPILLLMAIHLGVSHIITVTTAMIAVMMTFAGHGLYAIGWWPTPAKFYAMTTVILGVEYPGARTFLRIAGSLDFAVCIGIWFPFLRRISAAYASLWGFLTALARPVAGMSWELHYWGADQTLHEAILRAPHCLIPLYLFLLWQSQNADTEKETSLKPSTSP